MDAPFDLDPIHRRLRRSTREIAHDVLSGIDDRARHITSPHDRFVETRPAYQQLVEAGLLRAILPESIGGTMRTATDLAVVAEELTAVNASVALTLFATTLGIAPLVRFGTAQQRRDHLPRFVSRAGAPLAAFALTEPGGSANFTAPAPAEGTRTVALRDSTSPAGDDQSESWVINGAKTWVSNVGGWNGFGPDVLCVVARTAREAAPLRGLSVFVLPGPVDGLQVVDTPDTIGYRSHSTPTVTLTGVRTGADGVVGAVGDGLQVVSAAFTPASVQVAVFGLALMRVAFDFALEFARSESRGGAHPIIEHQMVGQALVSARTRIEAVRSLTWRACLALDQNAPAATELALHAKIFGSETAVAVITDLMRVVGVESYSHDHPLGRVLQDALALPVFGGGNSGKVRQLHALLMAGAER